MQCPEYDSLELFASGHLAQETQDIIAGHLETCSDCSMRLAEVSENLAIVDSIQAIPRERPTEVAALPAQIGKFRVIRELGRGGMGVVYEAEQDHPQRRVALKLINRDAGSRQAVSRFTQEADILARLKHPFIAQVYEAGVAEVAGERRSYFAMEFVDGSSLREHLGTTSVTQRLALLAEVCDAVQYAHQNGVIHRDLNPRNVVVDADGHPKVLDFGVARLTDRDTNGTLQTEVGQILGTLPYMSPEHMLGDPQSLDTRCDIYSLGVMLYEMLAGRLPYDLSRRGLAEAAKVISETIPARLGSLDQTLSGDVETIVAKALEKRPAQRYQSASELAADIRRYLNDEPVVARPPTTTEQVRRFVRRHRPLVGALAAIGITLLMATAVSTWQAIRARRAEEASRTSEQRARKELAKFQAVNEFLVDTFGSANPANSPENPDITVREAIGSAVNQLDRGSLRDQPEVEGSVRAVIGETLRGLGDYGGAVRQLQTAAEVHRSRPEVDAAALATALNSLGEALEEEGRFAEAEHALREALTLRQQLYGEDHPLALAVMNNLGLVLQGQGKPEAATEMHRRAVAAYLRTKSKSTIAATALNNLAIQLCNNREFAEAESLFREALALDRELRGELHPNVAATMYNLSFALGEQHRLDEAEQFAREAISLQRQMLGEEHPHVATSLNNLALLVQKRGDLNEAERLLRESLAVDRHARGPRHTRVATTLRNLAHLLEKQQEFEEAQKLLTEALSIQEEVHGPSHAHTISTLFSLAKLAYRTEDYEASEDYFRRADQHSGDIETALAALVEAGHGKCLTQLHRFEEAEAKLLSGYESLNRQFSQSHRWTQEVADSLVELYSALGKEELANEWRERGQSP